MTNEDYETVIGKLVLTRLFLTHHHHGNIDELIEELVTEYLERRNRNEL